MLNQSSSNASHSRLTLTTKCSRRSRRRERRYREPRMRRHSRWGSGTSQKRDRPRKLDSKLTSASSSSHRSSTKRSRMRSIERGRSKNRYSLPRRMQSSKNRISTTQKSIKQRRGTRGRNNWKKRSSCRRYRFSISLRRGRQRWYNN